MLTCSPLALVAKANSGPNMETVVSQESPATRKSSFKEKLSQKFSSKKKSPIMAKKEQKPGLSARCLSVCVCMHACVYVCGVYSICIIQYG